MIRKKIIISVAVLLAAVFILIQLLLFKDRGYHSNVNDINEYTDEKTENTVIENNLNEETELPELEADVKSDEDTTANDSENDYPATSGDAEHDSEQQSDPEDDQKDIYIDEDGDIELPEVP